jgi:hypothetical protein
MDTRKAYQDKYEAQIKALGAKVAGIKGRAEQATAQAKIDFAPLSDGVQKRYEVAKETIVHIAQATDDTWDTVKAEADKVWNELERSVEGAFAAFKAHKKTLEMKKKQN